MDGFEVGQWLSGSTAKAYRPTLDQLEAAGYAVVKRSEVAADAARLSLGELRALIGVCRAGRSSTMSAVDSLRHLERRLAARLKQCGDEGEPG